MGKNHASQYANFGSLPTTSYSVMNKMTCPITPFIVPDSYHFMYPEQREAAVSWALNLLHE